MPQSPPQTSNPAAVLHKLFETQVESSVYKALRGWMLEHPLDTITVSELSAKLDEWSALAAQAMVDVRGIIGC